MVRGRLSVRIKAAVHVDHRDQISRPRWRRNRLLPGERELVVALRDLVLILSEPAARWLLAMLEAIVESDRQARNPQGMVDHGNYKTPVWDRLTVRIQVTVHVYHPGEVQRPRWEGRELVVTAGDLIVLLSEPAARWLLKALAELLVGTPGDDVGRRREAETTAGTVHAERDSEPRDVRPGRSL
jgi:hypothetical protein